MYPVPLNFKKIFMLNDFYVCIYLFLLKKPQQWKIVSGQFSLSAASIAQSGILFALKLGLPALKRAVEII